MTIHTNANQTIRNRTDNFYFMIFNDKNASRRDLLGKEKKQDEKI